jgi:hypothetical protein
MLAGAVNNSPGFGDVRALLFEVAPVTLQRRAAWAEITIRFGLPSEVSTARQPRVAVLNALPVKTSRLEQGQTDRTETAPETPAGPPEVGKYRPLSEHRSG